MKKIISFILINICLALNLFANDITTIYTPQSDKNHIKIASSYKNSCEDGEILACLEFAHLKKVGNGTKKDTNEAKRLYALACKSNITIGCIGAANVTDRYKDYKDKLYFYNRACDLGDLSSCVESGELVYQKDKNITKLMDIYLNTCNNGYHTGCVGLGISYGDNRTQIYDRSKELYYFDKGCNEGGFMGCLFALRDYEDNQNQSDKNKRDSYIKKIEEILIDGCNNKEKRKCIFLNNFYTSSILTEQNYQKGINVLEKLCNDGDAIECYMLAEIYTKKDNPYANETKSDFYYNKALLMIKNQCENGIYESCSSLADFYKEGTIVEKDEIKAFYYNDMACNYGILSGCLSIAYIYSNKDEIGKNYISISYDYYKKACDIEGFYHLCEVLESKDGFASFLQKDYKKIIEYFKNLISKNSSSIVLSSAITRMYNENHISEEDYKKVISLYNIGCGNGNGQYCYILGNIYRFSDDKFKDSEKSLEYYKKGCELQDEYSCEVKLFLKNNN